MTSKEKVLAAQTNAYAHSPMGGWWYIDISRDTAMLGEGNSEEAAWQNAAESLPAAPEPIIPENPNSDKHHVHAKVPTCPVCRKPMHLEYGENGQDVWCHENGEAVIECDKLREPVAPVEAKEKCGVVCPDNFSPSCILDLGHYQKLHSNGHTDWIFAEPKPTPSADETQTLTCPHGVGRCVCRICNGINWDQLKSQPDSSSIPYGQTESQKQEEKWCQYCGVRQSLWSYSNCWHGIHEVLTGRTYVPFTSSDACWCQPFDGSVHPECPMHKAEQTFGDWWRVFNKSDFARAFLGIGTEKAPYGSSEYFTLKRCAESTWAAAKGQSNGR